MVDVVLLHGTTQGAAGWGPLRQALADRGVTTAAPQLPTDRPTWPATHYAAFVRSALPEGTAAMAVAHSGSGALLPAVARAVGSAHALWLAAYVPQAGVSLLEEATRESAALFHPDWPGQDPASDHAAARRFLFHDCPADVQAWAVTTLRTFVPRGVYEEPAEDPLACGSRPTVVISERDRTLRPQWLRKASRRRLRTEPVTIDAGHSPHVSRTGEIAAMITGLLRSDARPRGDPLRSRHEPGTGTGTGVRGGRRGL